MRLEFIHNVIENDVLGKTIYNEDGSVLLKSGIKLIDSYIKRLQNLGVFHIYIKDDRLDDIGLEDEELSELKHSILATMSKVMKNISSASTFKLDDTLQVVEELINYLVERGDINKNLYEIKTYDNYTYTHSLDTGIMSAFMGLAVGLSKEELKELTTGALLHDIGKLTVTRDIICKDGKLTYDEYEEVKKHPVYAREILENSNINSEIVLKSILEHHERINGHGYPYGLKGDEISIYGKIVAICDVYDAIVNDRCYRNKYHPNEAYEYILGGSGTLFDVEVVKHFKATFSVYELGSCVRLSNNVEGYVIRQNKNFPDRPIIRVLYEGEIKKPIPFYEIDLLNNINLTIVKLVS